MASPATRRWGLAAIVGGGLAALALFWIATPACACVPPLTDSAREPSAGSAARDIAAAQERVFETHGRYAATGAELSTADLPPGAPLAGVRADGRTYEVVLEPADSTGRRCTVLGGRTRSDSVLPFRLSCSKP